MTQFLTRDTSFTHILFLVGIRVYKNCAICEVQSLWSNAVDITLRGLHSITGCLLP